MIKYDIGLGTQWVALYDNRPVTVRKIHVEDGEAYIWYAYYEEDRTFECVPEEFLRRFVQKEIA